MKTQVKWINRANGVWPRFSDHIKRRLKTRRSVLILVVGPPGEGKSYAAMKLCEHFDRSFNTDRIVADYESFMELANTLRRGQFLMLDEPAWTLAARKWLETLSQSMVDFLQTARFMGLGFVVCAINRNLVEKTTRLFLLSYMAVCIDRGHLRLYHIRASQFEDRVYHNRLGEVYLGLPSRRLYLAYENRRDREQRERYRQSLSDTKRQRMTTLSDSDIVELVEREGLDNFMDSEKDRIDKYKLMKRFRISEWKARNVAKLLVR